MLLQLLLHAVPALTASAATATATARPASGGEQYPKHLLVRRRGDENVIATTAMTSICPSEWGDSCRDDPDFYSKLQLPCAAHASFDCTRLGGLGGSLDDGAVLELVTHCPCSCKVRCGTWTLKSTSLPSPGTEEKSLNPSQKTSKSQLLYASSSPSSAPSPMVSSMLQSPYPSPQPTLSPTSRTSASLTSSPTPATSSPTNKRSKAPATTSSSIYDSSQKTIEFDSKVRPTAQPVTSRPSPVPSSPPEMPAPSFIPAVAPALGQGSPTDDSTVRPTNVSSTARLRSSSSHVPSNVPTETPTMRPIYSPTLAPESSGPTVVLSMAPVTSSPTDTPHSAGSKEASVSSSPSGASAPTTSPNHQPTTSIPTTIPDNGLMLRSGSVAQATSQDIDTLRDEEKSQKKNAGAVVILVLTCTALVVVAYALVYLKRYCRNQQADDISNSSIESSVSWFATD